MTTNVASLSLVRFQKRMEEMRTMMQTAQSNMDSLNDRLRANVENQKKINAMLEENKRYREALLTIKPPAPKRPALYVVK